MVHCQGTGGRKKQYMDSNHIKAKVNKYRKTVVTEELMLNVYFDEMNAQSDIDIKVLGKKHFDRADDLYSGSSTVTKAVRTTDPDSSQQTCEGKLECFHIH